MRHFYLLSFNFTWRPFIIYENNLFIGKANRYLLPFAKKYLFRMANLKVFLKSIKIKCVIGNIIRKEILNYEASRIIYKKKKFKNIDLSGSQAAKIFAEKLPDVFKDAKIKYVF